MTAADLVAVGATRSKGWRCLDGGEPRPNSHENELVDVVQFTGPSVTLNCWADLSRWWIGALGDGCGAWVETYVPGPASVADVRDLCRMLGIPAAEIA